MKGRKLLISILTGLCVCFASMAILSACGEKHTHAYTSEVTKEATCTKKGVITYTCSCNDTYTEEIPATGKHTWGDGKETIAPTCTEKGEKTFTCMVCKEETYTEAIPALKHNKVQHSAQEATCTEKGWQAYETCTRCDYTTYKEIPALKHNKVQHSAQEATCTEKGWNAYETCTRCDYTTYKEIPATGKHTWGKGTETKAPTCTKEGITTYTCTVCKTNTKTEPIDKLPHEYAEKWTSNSTYHWHECVCGDKKGEGKHVAGAPATATTPQTCTICGYVLQVETGILFNTLSVDGTKVYGKVSNATTEFSFINEVTVKGTATYVVDNDKDCGSPIYSKTVDLEIGDNTFYVLEMIGNDIKLFTVTIRRRPMYDVIFDVSGGSAVDKQIVEEDGFAVNPKTEKVGYHYEWDYNFNTPITKDTTIKAIWSPNTDTKYTVNYYWQNINDNYYSLHETDEPMGTSDTTAIAVIKEYEHFTYNASKSVISGNINPDGGQVLSVYYTRNTYAISVNNTSHGSITNSGNHKYGKAITATASVKLLGYEFVGWYSGEELLTTDTSYTFTVDKDVTANFTVKDEMRNFNFTSTATTCEITGIKDKTATEIVVPDYVTSISQGAFNGCSSLESITIPFVGGSRKKVTDTYQYPFGYIFGTSSYTGGTATIQYYYGSSTSSTTYSTYYIPTNLKKVTVTGGNILYGAFYNCSNLTSVVILDSVTSIAGRAFQGCSSLEEMTIPFVGASRKTASDTYQYPFGYIFGTISYTGGTATKQYYYGSSTSSTTYDTYYIPTSLKKVTVTGGNILYGAFYNCSNLTSVIIGDSVTSIGSYAFEYCYKLVEVINTSSHITIEKGSTSNGYVGYYALAVYNSNSGITESQLTNDNGYIIYTEGKKKILVGYNGTETDLILPSYITKINQYAFYNCSSLTSVVIGDSVTSIGEYAFDSCSSLTSVVIPDSVTSIGYDAFDYCSSLTAVYITDIEAWCNISFDNNSAANPLSYAKNLYLNNELVTELVIPDTVTEIKTFAFYNCTSLTSVEIPDSVTKINQYAFAYCSSLTSVVIGDSVTSINQYAFRNCSNLTSVIIGDSVTSIGGGAFYECSNLTSVYYKGTISDWSNISIGSFNGNLTSAPRYYYSETTPALNADGTAYDGNYWHYDTDGITPVIWVYTKSEE